MNKKITFLPIMAQDDIKKRLYNDLQPVNRLVDVLRKYNRPHDIDGIFQAVADGPNKELNAVMTEVEDYIKATKMPVYLQDDARQKARNSVNTDYSDDVRPVLATWNPTLEKEDLCINEYGEIEFTERYREKLIQYYTQELPAHLVEVLPDVKELLRLHKKINSSVNVKNFLERYFMFSTEKTEEEFYSILYSNRRF